MLYPILEEIRLKIKLSVIEWPNTKMWVVSDVIILFYFFDRRTLGLGSRKN